MPIPNEAIMPPKMLSAVVTQPGISVAKSAWPEAAVIDVRTSTAGTKRHKKPIA